MVSFTFMSFGLPANFCYLHYLLVIGLPSRGSLHYFRASYKQILCFLCNWFYYTLRADSLAIFVVITNNYCVPSQYQLGIWRQLVLPPTMLGTSIFKFNHVTVLNWMTTLQALLGDSCGAHSNCKKSQKEN